VPRARMSQDGPMRVPVYILAGGKSSRFGQDKAQIPIRGEPLILHVRDSVAPYSRGITVVADRVDKYQMLGLRTIADRKTHQGPLGGLYAALCDLSSEDWILLVSCDWLGLKPAWIERLLRARKEDALAIAFRGEKWEPLLSLYHSTLKKPVEEQLASSNLSLWRLLEAKGAIAVPLPDDFGEARSINSEEELPPSSD
jgi:molybdenum cofactor guanylyltransferase